jgi:shikimate kinase
MADASTPAITLIGPGGAGKSTVGALLAARLAMPFVDLDRRFERDAGGISEYIERHGYHAYAARNVATYRAFVEEGAWCVAALSSGFMTYPADVHPEYARLRLAIARRPTTFVLIPSLDPERCVAETVRRQRERSFARAAAREAAVIRERLPVYTALQTRTIETARPPAAIVDELLRALGRLRS